MITGKPWEPFTLDELSIVPDVLGIFELSDAHMETIYIGSSGAEGLQTRLIHYRKDRPDPCIAASVYHFRYEVCQNNAAWQARILEAYRGAHNGQLPPCNAHTAHEDIGGMLHHVETDKHMGRVVEDLQAGIHARGYVIGAVENSEGVNEVYQVFKVFDPELGEPVQTQHLSALPCLIAVSQENQKVYLRSIRPTTLIEMFHEEALKEAALAVEEVVVASMDEAGE